MTQSPYASAVTSATALDMIALDYTPMGAILAGDIDPLACLAGAQADNAVFICIECGSYLHATPTAESSREDQQRSLALNFVLDCCGKENMFSI